ncbi:hypothetical protein ALI22I_43205 [Saccharothrix sp. ALI-22-I]|uniref:hypothetical protein n=1 Tax=Saccharothrix sp. ALI-22-I TaxID=1933778 RepID=UPI00097C56B3|nr:hypothetical protein [Saccharothrix sp. ALI-22-I]ONI80201.1 hypothetical protein ALI22I_43205 [Saccharothrix sp. ALI-22-I]
MNDVDEGRDVRGLLDSVLEGDTGPHYSPEEVLRSARRATAQRRAIVTSALSAGLVVAVGAGVFLGVNRPSTVEAGSSLVLTTTTPEAVVLPTDVPPVPNTPEHAAELTAKLVAANVIPQGFELTRVAGAQAGPMEFYRFGEDSSDGYKATAVVADAKGRATLTMFVQSVSKHPECTPENNCVMGTPVSGASPVEPSVRYVDGVELTVIRSPEARGPDGLTVKAHFPDGTVVYAGVRNEVEVMVDGVPIAQPPTRDEVPFTEQQLIDMVVKPGFHY